MGDLFQISQNIFVDNLKSPYLVLDKDYILPSFSTEIHSPDSTQSYLNEVTKIFPEFFEGLSLLPEPRPKRDEGKIYLAKELETKFYENNTKLLYLLRLEPSYLGGADKSNYLTQGSQGKTPSVYTNRIYFTQKIISVKKIQTINNRIIDFVPNRIELDALYHETSNSILSNLSKLASEMFDEQDYEFLEKSMYQSIADAYESKWNEIWQLGRIFLPLRIEYGTVCFRPLFPLLKSDIDQFQKWNEAILALVDFFKTNLIIKEKIDFLINELRQLKAERTISPSGNMLWKIKFFDFSI